MSETATPRSHMIDEAAVAAAELRRDPYDFAYRRARDAGTG